MENFRSKELELVRQKELNQKELRIHMDKLRDRDDKLNAKMVEFEREKNSWIKVVQIQSWR